MTDTQTVLYFLVPDTVAPTSGNTITAERHARFSRDAGLKARVMAVGDFLETAGQASDPILVHAFNGYKTARFLTECVAERGCPLVITFTGTDANHYLTAPESRDIMTRTVAAADELVVYHDHHRETVLDAVGKACQDRLHCIPPAVTLPPEETTPAGPLPWEDTQEPLVFLLPAALRPVKRPAFAVEPLARLRQEMPRGDRIHLAVVGASLSEVSQEKIERAAAQHDWVHYLGEQPHSHMPVLYRESAVMLNTSRDEGLSNAVVEAMWYRRPVLASDIPGNRTAVRHEREGLLFQDRDGFYRAARRLAQDDDLRRRLGEAGRHRAETRFSHQEERRRHLAMYRRLLAR